MTLNIGYKSKLDLILEDLKFGEKTQKSGSYSEEEVA